MPRFTPTTGYAGTRDSGWQSQKNANTIHGEIDRAVRGCRPYGRPPGSTEEAVSATPWFAHPVYRTSTAVTRRVGEERLYVGNDRAKNVMGRRARMRVRARDEAEREDVGLADGLAGRTIGLDRRLTVESPGEVL
jgi:hypothetical protein